MADPTPQATPPNLPTPPAAPEPTHAERLHKALSIEVQALREQLASVPDADTLAQLQAKAERFDQISQQLPQWQQQLGQLHAREVAQLQAQHHAAQQDLAAAKLDAAGAAAFGQAGGRSELWSEFRAMLGGRLSAGPDGAPFLDGEPLGQRFQALVEADPHAVLAAFARPRFGSGSGARASRDGRAVSGQSLSISDGKSRLFAAGFGK
jgi:hypothetical protein